MKLITVQFEDSVDISAIAKGAAVSVGDGTTSLSGAVMALTDMVDPPAAVSPGHKHATPAGETGTAIE